MFPLSKAILVLISMSLIFCEMNLTENGQTLHFSEFQLFISKYNKTYVNEDEMNKRFSIFCQNFESLKRSSNLSSEDEIKYGITMFMDMTPEEFKQKYLTLKTSNIPENATFYDFNKNQTGRFLEEENIPDSWDWRDKGALSPIKNQGSCGGCWAFSAVSNFESIFYLKYGKMPILSVQQLIDCDSENWGCNGGVIHTAFSYIKNYGIASAVDYPFQSVDGKCNYSEKESKYSITNYVYSGSDNEDNIKKMLYKTGPLSITINANLLQYYTSGIIDVSLDECPYAPTHGVVIVGYGTTKRGLDYWTIRNSYGPDWGEDGFFRIARGRGLCGVNKYIVSVVLD